MSLSLAEAGATDATQVLVSLGSSATGLTAEDARRRLGQVGPNAVRTHGARPLAVLVRQLNSPLLLLLVAAALVSIVVGEHADAGIILGIIGLSVGLGFANEFRSERAVEALHDRIRHTALTVRDGRAAAVDVTELVPGDLVRLGVGDVVPADLRLLEADGLECDEAVLTGESLAEPKNAKPVQPSSPLALPSCAPMGTVVHAGTALGVVVRTGPRTAFGQIAVRLGQRHEQTAFQRGLRDFSGLLVRVTGVLAVSLFVINAALGRSLLESGLFALAIAVGLTPQLLPAIVTISLSTGARRLARAQVVVKRLVAIEDLGNVEVLCTDKTGTDPRADPLRRGAGPGRRTVRGDAPAGAALQRGGGGRWRGGGGQPSGPGPVGGSPGLPRRRRPGRHRWGPGQRRRGGLARWRQAAGRCAVRLRPPPGLGAGRRAGREAPRGRQGGSRGGAGALPGRAGRRHRAARPAVRRGRPGDRGGHPRRRGAGHRHPRRGARPGAGRAHAVAKTAPIEHDPPRYLIAELGGWPHTEAAQTVWRIAASRIRAYRSSAGVTDPKTALGPPPDDPNQHAQQQAVAEFIRSAGKAIDMLESPARADPTNPAFLELP